MLAGLFWLATASIGINIPRIAITASIMENRRCSLLLMLRRTRLGVLGAARRVALVRSHIRSFEVGTESDDGND
jgi:hypothetical protein